MGFTKRIITFLFLTVCLSAESQTLKPDDETFHWEGGVIAGLNNDGFEAGFNAAYFPIDYVGLKIGLSLAGEIWELEDWNDDFHYPYYDHDYDYALRFKFNPAIVLRTPRLIHWKSQDAGFHLFAEPGIVLSPGSSGSHRAQWFRQDLKCGINLQIYRCVITLGYGISNFSLYSGAPENHWGLPEKTDYVTHTVFAGCSYKF